MNRSQARRRHGPPEALFPRIRGSPPVRRRSRRFRNTPRARGNQYPLPILAPFVVAHSGGIVVRGLRGRSPGYSGRYVCALRMRLSAHGGLRNGSVLVNVTIQQDGDVSGSAVTIPVYQYVDSVGADYHPGCVAATVARRLRPNGGAQGEFDGAAAESVLSRLASEVSRDPERQASMPTLSFRSRAELVFSNGLPHVCAGCARPLDLYAPGVSLFSSSVEAMAAAGAAAGHVRDGDVVVACDEGAAGVVVLGAVYAVTPEVGAFSSADGIDWGTSFSGAYSHVHAFAMAALRLPVHEVTEAGSVLARGACVWCFGCHRDPVVFHPLGRGLVGAEAWGDVSTMSCAEANAWLCVRRDGLG